jgi:hypothetical protein
MHTDPHKQQVAVKLNGSMSARLDTRARSAGVIIAVRMGVSLTAMNTSLNEA